MYLQLTTRCNMTCAHCCFRCTAEGEDMSLETFYSILDWMAEHHLDHHITLGGGEPTLNKDLRHMIETFRWRGMLGVHEDTDAPNICVITNGKKVADALYLAKLARFGELEARLSMDDFHDPISQRVINAFAGTVEAWEWIQDPYEGRIPNYEEDYRGLNKPSDLGYDRMGRALDNHLPLKPKFLTEREEDCCRGWFFKPDGTIQGCSCPDHPKLWHINGKHPNSWEMDQIEYGHCIHDLEELRQGELFEEAI